jgi:hypothetical protein
MKKVLAFTIAGIFLASMAAAQEQDKKTLNQFTRTEHFLGAKLSFVHLNPTTINMFFKGPSKETILEKAKGGTCFFIMGTAEKPTKMNTDYVAIQEEAKIPGTIMNITNFDGVEIAKGGTIRGILILSKKLDPTKQFTLKTTGGFVDFKLSDEALRNITE